MAKIADAKVSHRGQTSIPADLRHRWDLDAGGSIGVIDLGSAALLVPGGADAARRELHRVLRQRYPAGLDAIGDADLVDQ